jgi:biotin carboxyl carrier protein
MRKIFSVKGNQINTLSALSANMTTLLDTAYTNNKSTGVVVGPVSSTDDGTITGTITTNSEGPNDPPTTQTTSTKQTADGSIKTTDVEFRVPSIENQARNERAQLSLGKEVISFVRESHYQDQLETVFANELAAIDADVNRIQIAYLNTILVSPIEGVVTGVYKNPGDSVRAGEPVFRVENDFNVFIVAHVVFRGPVLLNSVCRITTTLFGAPVDAPGSTVVSGDVVSARGQGGGDQWELVVEIGNLDNTTGKKIFPLGYCFDNDITTVTIEPPHEL